MGDVVPLGARLVVHRTPRQVERDRERLVHERRAAKWRANGSRQRAVRLQRTAAWADGNAIRAFYVLSARLTHQTGVEHEVDHIIPLRGRLVSGLHVENNLRVVTKAANRAKSNHFAEEVVGGAGIEPATSTV